MLGKIEGFLQRAPMSATRFGRMAANDPRLVLDMRNGRAPGPQMAGRLDAFMQACGR